MFGYVTVGANNFHRVLAFYVQLLDTTEINRPRKPGHLAAQEASYATPALRVVSQYD